MCGGGFVAGYLQQYVPSKPAYDPYKYDLKKAAPKKKKVAKKKKGTRKKVA